MHLELSKTAMKFNGILESPWKNHEFSNENVNAWNMIDENAGIFIRSLASKMKAWCNKIIRMNKFYTIL